MMNGHTDTNSNVSRFEPRNRFAPTNRFGAPTTAERAGSPRVGSAGCGCGSCDRCKEASGKTVQPAPAPAPPPAPPPVYTAPPVGAGQMRQVGAGNAFTDAVWTNRTKGERIAIGVGAGLATLLLGWGIVALASGGGSGASEAAEGMGDGDADDALDDAGLYQDPDRPCETLADVADAFDVDIADARVAAANIDAPKLGKGYVLTRDKAIELDSELETMAAEEPDEDEDLEA